MRRRFVLLSNALRSPRYAIIIWGLGWRLAARVSALLVGVVLLLLLQLRLAIQLFGLFTPFSHAALCRRPVQVKDLLQSRLLLVVSARVRCSCCFSRCVLVASVVVVAVTHLVELHQQALLLLLELRDLAARVTAARRLPLGAVRRLVRLALRALRARRRRAEFTLHAAAVVRAAAAMIVTADAAARHRKLAATEAIGRRRT